MICSIVGTRFDACAVSDDSPPGEWVRPGDAEPARGPCKEMTLLGKVAVPLATCWLALGVWVHHAAAGEDPQSNQAAPASDRLTFSKDIAPIFFRHCWACHHPGGPAPFSVHSYAEVGRRAEMILAMTQSRRMPPWLPDPGYVTFANERRLTGDDILKIRRWAEQGAVEGDVSDLPPLPRFAEGWQLGEPDLVVTLPEPYLLPAEGSDEFRNFVVPIPVPATRFVRAIELRPGSPRFIHHAVVAIDHTRSSRRRDEQDGQPGFDGMDLGQAHIPGGELVVWTPGMVPFVGSPGTAWRLQRGTDLVLQLHMVPSGKSEVIRPSVGFYFAQEPPTGPQPYLLRLYADEAIDIPAGEKRFVVTDTIELPVDVEAIAVYPHAHFLAKTIEGWAELPDGAERWLIHISDWDFDWQDAYRYDTPISLPRGTKVSMRFSYDNSSDNVRNPHQPPRRVTAGNRSSDEMAHLWLQVRPRRAEDLARLKEALFRHALTKTPNKAWPYASLGSALREQRRLPEAARQFRAALAVEPDDLTSRTSLGLVLLELGEVDEAITQFREALRFDPDSASTHYNLGVVSGLQHKPDAAIEHYLEALRLEPDFVDAHLNLGAALGLKGEIDEAISHLRRALELDPANVKARQNLELALRQAAAARKHRALRRAIRVLRGDVNEAGAMTVWLALSPLRAPILAGCKASAEALKAGRGHDRQRRAPRKLAHVCLMQDRNNLDVADCAISFARGTLRQ